MSRTEIKERSASLLTICAVFWIGLSAMVPAAAQTDSSEPPENAQLRRFGGGWECDPGYREREGACAAVAIPENA